MRLPATKPIFLLQLGFCAAVLLAGSCIASAQSKDPSPTPTPEARETEDEDRIYSSREVDVKARLLHFLNDQPSPGADCRAARFRAIANAVLHKSGKATDVELVRGSGCKSFDVDLVRVLKNLKFEPALKDGQPVSQYQKFEFMHTRL